MNREPTRPPPNIPGLTYVQHLGTGGYADVFLYEQAKPARMVAVKVLHANDLDEDVQRSFEAEADTMAKLSDHPFIVPVMWTAVTDDHRPYIVMKYYPKPNLAVRARREQFSVVSVLQIGIQISSAVETAHRARILHRDIKPHNILTDHYGDPGLTDFGIAATTADSIANASGMSVPWSPPEILFGVADGDERSDVYSLGATLWHLLAGRAPYDSPGDNGQAAHMRRIQQDPVPAVPRSGIPESLQSLLRQTLAKSPDGRPQSALAVARELQAIEQERRLPLTRIVVPDPPATGRQVLDDDDEDVATWVRSVRIIEAQRNHPTTKRGGKVAVGAVAPAGPRTDVAVREVPPPPLPVADDADVAETPKRPRVPAPEPPEEPTVKRPLPNVVAAQPVEEAQSPRVSASLVATIAASAVVFAAGLTAVVADGPQDKREVETSAATDVALPVTYPDTPHVTAARTPNGVLFTLSYEDKIAGDEFQWALFDGVSANVASGSETTTATTLELPVKAGAQTCVTAQVVRAGTRGTSPSSPRVCAP